MQTTSFIILIVFIAITFCNSITTVTHSEVISLARQATTDFPPFDDPPTIPDGHTAFILPLEVKSDLLGLSIELVLGIKLVLSQSFGFPEESWAYRGADLIDEEKSIFYLEYEVIIPDTNTVETEKKIHSFINEGKLSAEFAALGIDSLIFSVQGSGPGLSDNKNVTNSQPETILTPVDATNVSSDTSNTVPQVQESPASKDLILDVIPIPASDEEIAEPLPLYILSPTIFFPDLLREAIVWFIADATGTSTEPPSWFMPEFTVLNESLGQYIGSFTHVGIIGTTDFAVAAAKVFVSQNLLNKALAEEGATGINVQLLPKLELANVMRPVFPAEDQEQVNVSVRISAPLSGFTQNASEILQTAASKATSTSKSSWRLISIKETALNATNGPWAVTFSLTTPNSRMVVSDIVKWIRSRAPDHLLWEQGWSDIRVRALPRLTKFRNGSGQSGVVTATPETVAASIAGMLFVVAIGVGVQCLLPRGDEAQESRPRRKRLLQFWR